MFRLMLKLVLVVTVAWVVPIALIRTQPYDDSDLRAFLTPPEGCPAPCFMGIRPDMSVGEAIAILGAHEWVKSLEIDLQINDSPWPPIIQGEVTWEWSGLQPPEIDALETVKVSTFDGTGIFMYVPTKITFGQLMLMRGVPDNASILRFDEDPTARVARFRDADSGFAFNIVWHCLPDSTWWPWHFKLTAKSAIMLVEDDYSPEAINMIRRLTDYC